MNAMMTSRQTLLRNGWARRLRPAAVLCVLLLAGCAVGPDYRRPDIDLGAAYGQAAEPVDPTANAGWVQVKPGEEALRPDWWTLYGDNTLNQLMTGLEAENLDIRMAEARYRQAQASLQSARSGLFPTIGSNASVERSGSGGGSVEGREGGTGSLGGGPSNSYALSTSVSWEIDLWGRVRRSVEAGWAALSASAADIDDVRLSMQSTLAQTYFSLRVTDAEIELMQQTVQAYERSLNMTQQRYNARVAMQADVAAARTQVQALQRQRATSAHAIAVRLGRQPAACTVFQNGDNPLKPTRPGGVPVQLLPGGPVLVAGEPSMAAANALSGMSQAAWFPP